MIQRQLVKKIGQDFSKDVATHVRKGIFSFQQSHMQLQSHLMRIRGKMPKKAAKLNPLRKATD